MRFTLGKKMWIGILLFVMLFSLGGCAWEDKVIEYRPPAETHDFQDVITYTVTQEEGANASDTNQDDFQRFFYNQLTDLEKGIYEKLLVSKELFINNEAVFCGSYSGESGVSEEYHKGIIRAVIAYRADNPEASIWLHTYQIKADPVASYDAEGKYDHTQRFDVYIIPEKSKGSYSDFANPDETREAIAETERVAVNFVETLSGTDEEKLKQIHDWILNGAEYDDTNGVSNIRSIYGAIIQKKCVCAGFAFAYKYVADLAGLNTIYVSGVGTDGAKSPEPHAWNHVYVNGMWVLVDLTWDLNARYEMVVDEENVTSYQNDDGTVVTEYTYKSVPVKNYDYLFADIIQESVSGRHVSTEEYGFCYS